MNRARRRLAALTFLVACAGAPAADAPDERDVRAVADAAFDAIREKDQAAMQALFLPEGMSTRLRAGGDAPLRQMKNAEFIDQAFGGDDALEERWTETPAVRVDGDLATIWGHYTFHVDGAVSHCGVNAVDLVRLDGVWKIANWTWSVETEGCPAGAEAPQALGE